MKIIVCVKQVSLLGEDVDFTPDERNVDPDYLDHALNEWDSCAVQEGLRIRDDLGGEDEVVVISVGDDEVVTVLHRCLGMGVERAVRIEGVEELDPFTVARALADVVADENPGLVLCGAQSSDSVQATTGPALATFLGLPSVSVVTKLDWDGSGPAEVHRELEGGTVDVLEVDTPALLTIQTGINEPRYVTLRAIKQAEQKTIEVHQASERDQSAYRVRRMFVPPRGEGAEMLGDDPLVIAGRMHELLQEALK